MDRNQVAILREKDKKVLRQLIKFKDENHPILPIPSDISHEANYRTILNVLYKLQKMNYITLHYKRHRIRAIEVLFMP